MTKINFGSFRKGREIQKSYLFLNNFNVSSDLKFLMKDSLQLEIYQQKTKILFGVIVIY